MWTRAESSLRLRPCQGGALPPKASAGCSLTGSESDAEIQPSPAVRPPRAFSPARDSSATLRGGHVDLSILASGSGRRPSPDDLDRRALRLGRSAHRASTPRMPMRRPRCRRPGRRRVRRRWPWRFWRERRGRPRLQIESKNEHGAAAGIGHAHAPAGEILDIRIAHCGLQFADLLRCACARGAQSGEVDAAAVGELTRAVGEMEIEARHQSPSLMGRPA